MFSKDEERELRLEFWRKFKNRTRKIKGQRGRAKVWIGENTGVKGVDLRFDLGRDKIIVALEINHKNEDSRLTLYEKLEATKKIFENEFGENLIWDFAYEKKLGEPVCRVYSQMDGDFLVSSQWPEIFNFMIDKMLRMEQAFNEVSDFLRYKELGK